MDEKTVNQIAQAVVARIIPAIRDGGANGRMHPRLMNTRQCAEYLGLSVSSVEHLKFHRKIPFVQVGRRISYDRLELDRWIDRNKV